jgi:hypothetical protein
MVSLNHLIRHHRAERGRAIESSRLRGALISELQALHKAYCLSLELIESGANYLMSTRSVVLVYKGNLGRLTSLLEPAAIECAIAVFAENEMIEGLLAAHAAGKGGVSYRLTPDSQIEELERMYAAGREQIIKASAILAGFDAGVDAVNLAEQDHAASHAQIERAKRQPLLESATAGVSP